MSTPQRRALRPLNGPNQSPSTSPASSSHEKSLRPRLSPSSSPSPDKENLHSTSTHPSPSRLPPTTTPTRRRRRQVMRLSELMASVAMTPIKEREEEDGLSSLEVEVPPYQDKAAQQRAQEEEIQHYHAMMEEERRGSREEEDEALTLTVPSPSDPPEGECGYDSDDFHSADEAEFQWEEEDGMEDKRRPSITLLISPPRIQPSPHDGTEHCEDTSDALLTEDTPSPPPRHPSPPPSLLPTSALSPPTPSTPSTRLHVALVEGIDPTSPPSPSSPCSPLPSLLSPLPPSHPPTPTPSPTCSSCSSLFLSLQHYQSECDHLTQRVEHLTSEGSELYAEWERKSVRVRELQLQKERRDEEEEERQRREEEDYRSLYFAYVQLDREHKALQASINPSTALHLEEEREAGEEADYLAMSEEKRLGGGSPVGEATPLSCDEGTEVESLRAEVIRLQSLLEAKGTEATVATEAAAAYRGRYEELLAVHSSQASTFSSLASVLEGLEALDELQVTADVSRIQQVQEAKLQALALEEKMRDMGDEVQHIREERDALISGLTEAKDTLEYVHAERAANEEELGELKKTLTSMQGQLDARTAELQAVMRVQQGMEVERTALKTEGSHLKTACRDLRMALRAAQDTLHSIYYTSEALQTQLTEATLRISQLDEEKASCGTQHLHDMEVAGQREAAILERLQGIEERRSVTEARLRSSEEQVQSLTKAMATLHQQTPSESPPPTPPPSTLPSDLLHLQQKYTTLSDQHRAMSALVSSLQSEVAGMSQREVRLRVALAEEKEVRERAESGKRLADENARKYKDEVGAWEGRWEAMEHRGKERTREREEWEGKVREKELLIGRLSRTVKEMHRHIEGGGGEVERLKGMIGQYQQVLGHVGGMLRQGRYAGDEEVHALLTLLDKQKRRESKAGKDRKDGEEVG